MKKYNQNRVITPAMFKVLTGIHITEKHTGKMYGLSSVSTSCLLNPFCQARRLDKDSICAHCYAAAMLEATRKNMNPCLTQNFEILTTEIIDVWDLPTIYAPAFRFEAFGDVYNDIQMLNYINIAKKNPNVPMAIFSKNWQIVENAFRIYGKPENMQFIYSWSKMNGCREDAEAFKAAHPCIDKVFIVVDAEFALENDIIINCARECINCLKCYTANDESIIYEILKSEEKRYFKSVAKLNK